MMILTMILTIFDDDEPRKSVKSNMSLPLELKKLKTSFKAHKIKVLKEVNLQVQKGGIACF